MLPLCPWPRSSLRWSNTIPTAHVCVRVCARAFGFFYLRQQTFTVCCVPVRVRPNFARDLIFACGIVFPEKWSQRINNSWKWAIAKKVRVKVNKSEKKNSSGVNYVCVHTYIFNISDASITGVCSGFQSSPAPPSLPIRLPNPNFGVQLCIKINTKWEDSVVS